MKTLPALLLLVGCATPFAGAAQPSDDTSHLGAWWVDGSLGCGYVRREYARQSETSSLFYMSLAGGRVVTERFWIGAEATGWLYEASNLDDPSKGESLSQVLVTSRIFLTPNGHWNVALGGGYAAFTSNHAGEGRDSGFGWSAGIGYDFAPKRRSACVVRVLVSGNDLADENYQALTLAVGWRYR